MNFFALSILLMAAGGLSFGFLDGFDIIKGNISSMFSVVSIVSAAILVRLNRGIPTVDWKSVDEGALSDLLNRLEDIVKAYIVTISVALLCIIVLFVVMLLPVLSTPRLEEIRLGLAVGFGMLLGLMISRTGFIVWLDLDIARLQATVIRSVAAEIEVKGQREIASDKMRQIKDARIETSVS